MIINVARFYSQQLVKPLDHTSRLLKHVHHDRLVPFHYALEQQEKLVKANLDYKRKLARAILDDKKNEPSKKDKNLKPSPTVFTYEIEPTYTGGKRTKKEITDEQIAKFEHFVPDTQRDNPPPKFIQLERGGEITFHGPGQLVAFFVVDLKSFESLTARKFVSILEQSIINTLREHNVAEHEPYSPGTPLRKLNLLTKLTEKTGVWTTNDKKIASIGIHVRRSITSHGLSININTDLSYTNSFKLCGIPNGQQTSINEEMPRIKLTVREVAVTLVKQFATLMGIHDIETTSCIYHK